LILRACTVCGSLSDQGRCEQHRPTDDRPSAARRGYGAPWRVIRARYLRTHMICEEPGCGLQAIDVDHVDGLGPSGDNSDANLQALCHPHHSEKTARENGSFGRRPALRRDSAG
jgi:5-methylcytosine-specific restriction protein A